MHEVIEVVKDLEGKEVLAYLFYCQGCEVHHAFEPGRWSFNGDLVKPTFRPSLRIEHEGGTFCHLWLTDGVITYLPDCLHELADEQHALTPVR